MQIDEDVQKILNEVEQSFISVADEYQFNLTKALREQIKDESAFKVLKHKPLSEHIFEIFGVYEATDFKRKNFEIIGNLNDVDTSLAGNNVLPAKTLIVSKLSSTNEDFKIKISDTVEQTAKDIIDFLGVKVKAKTESKDDAETLSKVIRFYYLQDGDKKFLVNKNYLLDFAKDDGYDESDSNFDSPLDYLKHYYDRVTELDEYDINEFIEL